MYDHILDPLGDVILTLQNPNAPFATWHGVRSDESCPSTAEPVETEESVVIHEPVTFLLSSRHLVLASPVLKAALTGTWKESVPRETDGLREINTEGCDVEAMTIVMSIIHHKWSQVPRMVNLELQRKIAAAVDYYQIHEMIHLIDRLWVTEELFETELFETADVPEFVNTEDYWAWRNAFRRFAATYRVKDSDVTRALYRVVLRFSGPQVQGHISIFDNVCRMASGWSWTQAWKSLLKETDSCYIGPLFYREQIDNWREVRGTKMETPMDFFLRFRTCLGSLNEAADIARSWRPTDVEVMSQLIVSLPSHIRDECYQHIPNFGTGTLDEYRARIVQIWTYTPWPESGNGSTPRTTGPGRAANTSCNKPCWETTPVIPTNLRGPARGRDRNTYRPELADLCFRCRRPLETDLAPRKDANNPDGTAPTTGAKSERSSRGTSKALKSRSPRVGPRITTYVGMHGLTYRKQTFCFNFLFDLGGRETAWISTLYSNGLKMVKFPFPADAASGFLRKELIL